MKCARYSRCICTRPFWKTLISQEACESIQITTRAHFKCNLLVDQTDPWSGENHMRATHRQSKRHAVWLKLSLPGWWCSNLCAAPPTLSFGWLIHVSREAWRLFVRIHAPLTTKTWSQRCKCPEVCLSSSAVTCLSAYWRAVCFVHASSV